MKTKMVWLLCCLCGTGLMLADEDQQKQNAIVEHITGKVRQEMAKVLAAYREVEVDEMERVHLAEGTSGPEDLAFHLAIYDATHNPLFRQLLEQMREAFERFWDHPFDREDFARRSFPFHRELFDAIVDQDTAMAREKTLRILEVVEEDIREMSR